MAEIIWEYHPVIARTKIGVYVDMAQMLNHMGAKSWELVTVINDIIGDEMHYQFFFKRPKQDITHE